MNLRTSLTLAILSSVTVSGVAQDRLSTMPRYDRYTKLSREISSSVKRGEVTVTWAKDGDKLQFLRDSKSFVLDLKSKKLEEGTLPTPMTPERSRVNRAGPDRGRQYDTAMSPDGKQKAFHRDRNLFLSDAEGKNEVAITTEGNAKDRTKFGVASWVYGEELNVREAMWWKPDGTKLAFYGFDESKVPDFFLAMDQTKLYTTVDTEAYPKAGSPNPLVTLYLLDVASMARTVIDTKFADPTLDEYIYDVRWSPAGDELYFNRTNRKQNHMQFCAADPATGKCRVIIDESQPNSWVENSPPIRWLKDQKRFLWMSERNGFQNLYLYDVSGKLLSTLTKHEFEVNNIVAVDEDKRDVYYIARSGEGPGLAQLHRVSLDGKRDVRLTDPKLSHRIQMSPKFEAFVDVAERNDVPPITQVMDSKGKVIAELARSDLSKFEELKLKKSETVSFTAADGKTKCYGTLDFPSDFDPAKKYPLIVSVYAGPESGGGFERFQTPDTITEFGFLTASFDGRGTKGRGKAFKDAVYGKLGIVEIDDQAAGVKELAKRPYVDGKRVGVHGTSYGGYASAMALLRHPTVFKAAAASSSVTSWVHYDSIYTERYMGLPWDGENKEGYENGSAMKYAKDLKGRLLLYFGTADNNVHPSNTMQLAQALERAGKGFDMSVGPDRGHTGVNFSKMLEFFIENLILDQPADVVKLAWKSQAKSRIVLGR